MVMAPLLVTNLNCARPVTGSSETNASHKKIGRQADRGIRMMCD
jgi:hypothetical protein